MDAWNLALIPFIHTGNVLYLALMLGIVLSMLAVAVLAKSFLPINNWAKVIITANGFQLINNGKDRGVYI